MYKPNGFHIISTVILAVSLMLITIQAANAGTGRNSNYSSFSAHGGYIDNGGDGTRGVDRLAGYAPGNCAHCHEQHASVGGSQPPPSGASPSPYMLFDNLTGNTFCIYCHDGTQSNADNISQQISKSIAHDPTSGNVLCVDCHESHEATPATHSEAIDGNTSSGVLTAVSGVTAAWTPPSSPSEGSESINSPTLTIQNPDLGEFITMEYQLCLKCHGGQTLRDSSTLPDIGRQFNPNFAAVHPVTTSTWNNAFLVSNNTTALKNDWALPGSVDKQMYCSDCHSSNGFDTGDPAGPHGSTNPYLLRAAGTGFSLDNLCTTCHNVLTATGGSSKWDSDGPLLLQTADRDHNYPSHQYDIINNPEGCLGCHGGIGYPSLESSVHGANLRGNTNGGPGETGRLSKAFLFNPNRITKNYVIPGGDTDTIGDRYCAATCHNFGAAYKY